MDTTMKMKWVLKHWIAWPVMLMVLMSAAHAFAGPKMPPSFTLVPPEFVVYFEPLNTSKSFAKCFPRHAKASAMLSSTSTVGIKAVDSIGMTASRKNGNTPAGTGNQANRNRKRITAAVKTQGAASNAAVLNEIIASGKSEQPKGEIDWRPWASAYDTGRQSEAGVKQVMMVAMLRR